MASFFYGKYEIDQQNGYLFNLLRIEYPMYT